MSTDILFVKNPISTSMGTLFGIFIHGVFNFFSPLFQSYELVKVSAFNVFHFVAFGIFGFNVKNLMNRHKVSSEVELTIKFIEEQLANGHISKMEAKQQYRVLIAKAVDNVKVNSTTREDNLKMQDQ